MSDYSNWVSCCRGRDCPEIKLDEAFLYIKDDYGNKVKIQRSNMESFFELLKGVMIATAVPTSE